MKNTLHIFGCSHSFKSTHPKYWTDILAEKLNLNLFFRNGLPGRNVEYILLDIMDRILNNTIQKNDLVILNTSYPLRFGTPRLQSYSKHPIDTMIDITTYANISFDTIQTFDDLIPEITFSVWYSQTYGAWKLLSSVCDNVYQWCLDDTTEMDSLYLKSIEEFRDLKKKYSSQLGIDLYPWDTNLNPWNNLIKPPIEFKTWNNFIQSQPLAYNDYHLNPKYYNEFSDLFIEQIKYNNEKI